MLHTKIVDSKKEKILTSNAEKFIKDFKFGASIYFLGTVRNINDNKTVTGITYDSHDEMVIKSFEKIYYEANQKLDIKDKAVFIEHAKGHLKLGEISIIIAVACKHRDQAYVLSRYIIEEIKKRSPIWKKEHYEDEESEWLKGNPIANEKILPNQDKIAQVKEILSKYIISLMSSLEKKIFDNSGGNSKVILISGVNGVGKTTTIGKLGKILKKNKKKIIFAAADTFRAAAIEQLENWSNKVGAKLIKSEKGSDPASVAFKALEFSKQNNFDYVLIDTAGRLQNKKNLMEEYKKIVNVTKKIDKNAPHEIFLVLDATTGQNAINQVEEFQKISPITGLIMTKLDGTAKGGILLAIAKKFKIPIIALGLGENEDDLQIFNAKDFAKALIKN